jgi:hypothetical protein
MLLGGEWLGQTSGFEQRVAIVDDLADQAQDLVASVFQRINPSGDMLRIASNVKNTDGSRAVGTMVPAINPDGKPNAMIATVLNGGTYSGRTFAAGGWYLAVYEPIYDQNQSVVGLLALGVPQESVTSLRNAIINTQVGTTGYVYVLDSEGHYVISQNGTRDGELIWDAKDESGNFFVQEIIQKGKAARAGEFAEVRYP